MCLVLADMGEKDHYTNTITYIQDPKLYCDLNNNSIDVSGGTQNKYKVGEEAGPIFHHQSTDIGDYQDYLVSSCSPSPDTLVVRIISFDEWMVRHA